MRWAVSTSEKPGATSFCSARRSWFCARGNNGKSAGFARTGRPRWNLKWQSDGGRNELHASPIKEVLSELTQKSETSRRRRLLWLLFLALCCSCALACGPYFPNMMLVGGDQPVFTAPVARFCDELSRMQKRLNI